MRAYVKPELFYENFELAQNIATCDWDKVNNAEAMACQFSAWYDPAETIFTSDVKCTVTDVEAYCEYNSTNGFGLFNS